MRHRRRNTWWDDWCWFYREARALGPVGLAVFAATVVIALILVALAVLALAVLFA
jgi:hypothetical protein